MAKLVLLICRYRYKYKYVLRYVLLEILIMYMYVYFIRWDIYLIFAVRLRTAVLRTRLRLVYYYILAVPNT